MSGMDGFSFSVNIYHPPHHLYLSIYLSILDSVGWRDNIYIPRRSELGQRHLLLCLPSKPRAPPSLKNMYIALKKHYAKFTLPVGDLGLLTPWVKPGILLLNECLTVNTSEANNHSSKGWERLTQKVIDVVAAWKGVVILAWGKPAEKRVANIDRRKHAVLLSVHPSPLSASRGFVSSCRFSLVIDG